MDAATETAPPTAASTAKTARPATGKPFVKGDPRIRAGPGRPPLDAAEKERRAKLAALAEEQAQASKRIVADLTQELLKVSGKTVDTLVDLLDHDDAGIRLRASLEIANRLWGSPISRSEVIAQISTSTEVHRVSPAELADAARLYLLRQGAAQAEAVE